MELANLYKLNYGAFSLHLLSAIGLIITFSIIRKSANFNTNLWTYKITSVGKDKKNIDLEAYEYLDVSTISLEVLLVLIFLITAFFHLYYATDGFKSGFYKKELLLGYNRLRWLEYGITSTLMMYLLVTLSGVKDFDAAFSLCMINFLLISYGYFLETSTSDITKKLSLSLGFISLIFIWAVVFRNFGYRITESKEAGENIPSWIYGVLIPMFFWWTSFGVVATIKYVRGGDPNKYEMWYIILSYLSKAFMGYYFAFGILRDPPE